MKRLLIPILALATLLMVGCEKQDEPQSAVPPSASSEGAVVTPPTLHQEQTVEGMEALEGSAPAPEPKTLQDAAGHPAPESPHQAEALAEIAMRFRHSDLDKDGQVSQEEAKVEVDLAKTWTMLDDNGDGKLSLTEYQKRTIPSHQAQ